MEARWSLGRVNDKGALQPVHTMPSSLRCAQLLKKQFPFRCVLQCLGVAVTKPTEFFSDNFGIIQCAEIPEGELSKKHIATSFHCVREAIAAKIVNAH